MEGSHESAASDSHPTSHEASLPAGPEPSEKSWPQKVKDKFLPGVRITLLISLIFYIAMFVVGIWGVHKCPVEDNIPFFLIVTGGIGLLSKATSVVREVVLKHYPVQYVESSFYSVELVFLLLGAYWVFKTYKPSYNPVDSSRYCNKTVYMFAFIYLAVLYSLMFIILICFCCFLGCIFFVKNTERVDQDPESPTRPIRVSTSESDHDQHA